jgi:hypothetical protein
VADWLHYLRGRGPDGDRHGDLLERALISLGGRVGSEKTNLSFNSTIKENIINGIVDCIF